MAKSLLLIAFVFALPTFAEECPTIELDKNGGPMAQIPIYNQRPPGAQESSICYTITAASLIDAHRASQSKTPLKQFTAPISLASYIQTRATVDKAIYSNQSDKLKLPDNAVLQSGRTDEVINAVRGRKVCDENFLGTFDGLREGGKKFTTPSSASALIEAIIVGARKYKKYVDGGMKGPAPIEPYLDCRLGHDAGGVYSLKEVIGLAANQSLRPAVIQEFLASLCEKRDFTVDVPKARSIQRYELPAGEDKSIGMQELVSMNLGKPYGRPVGIGFCAGVIHTSKSQNFADTKEQQPLTCDGHSSVVVGQQYNPDRKSCQFKVRIGYGNDCGAKEMGLSKEWTCDGKGNLWMDARTLAKNISGVQFIPDK